MKEKIRIVQLHHTSEGRKVALVEEPFLRLLSDTGSVYELALDALQLRKDMIKVINSRLSETRIDYDAVYDGENDWKLLPSFDHPDNPLFCLVSGTGLTYKNSALNRQMMHVSAENKPTDSMQIYQWGIEGGNPEKGKIGVQPEWFYKGSGAVLKAHATSLQIPPYGNDGGEDPELAGIYIVDKNGEPFRIDFTTANEFSDHIMEKKNYLYLAPSKLRECAIGPQLVIDPDFSAFTGKVSVRRKNQLLWSADIKTGENNMCHNLANLEYHHFKYAGHRIPYQAHVHFFGADAFSFGSQVKLEDGDVMSVYWEGMGRALKNFLKIDDEEEKMMVIKSL
ncbi:MAG: AraD1 family protein [Chitinophagaceae bacterium]